jgi:hypothetical protein
MSQGPPVSEKRSTVTELLEAIETNLTSLEESTELLATKLHGEVPPRLAEGNKTPAPLPAPVMSRVERIRHRTACLNVRLIEDVNRI